MSAMMSAITVPQTRLLSKLQPRWQCDMTRFPGINQLIMVATVMPLPPCSLANKLGRVSYIIRSSPSTLDNEICQ